MRAVVVSIWVAVLMIAETAAQTANHGRFDCFTHHGRLSSQNGIALKIWLIGTNRVVGVDEEVPRQLDDLLSPYLLMTSEDHSYVYGDFELCPTEPDVPGHMRHVRVTGAKRLVVQRVDASRPAFKLMSTCPD